MTALETARKFGLRRILAFAILATVFHGGLSAWSVADDEPTAAAQTDDQPTESPVHPASPSPAFRPADVEFFEQEVRPILAGVCANCHVKGDDSEGGLQLDTRAHMLSGGYRGPAVVLGAPDNSLLIQAVRRKHDELSMPPDDALPEDQVATLVRWVEMGAPWPDDRPIAQMHTYWDGEISEADREYWAFQPLCDPALPEVADSSWPKSPIDYFILAQLEAEGLRPTTPADRRTLLRRVSFDLIGLPPTLEEVEAFVADESADAWRRVVNRLLDSPHYGERWGRHWLDVVRYAETNGLDNDYPKPNAWRYRDYVIRAFNDDLPYDVFLREHIAGDLLPEPRLSRDGDLKESPLATGHYWFGEMLNVPVDPVSTLARELENRIDVFGKAFLGMTIACARCHDHKFDPIRQADYYALAGFFNSMTNVQACVDSESTVAEIQSAAEQIGQINSEMRELRNTPEAALARVESRLAAASNVAEYLLAARVVLQVDEDDRDAHSDQVASDRGIPPQTLKAWVDAIDAAPERHDPLLYVWHELLDAEGNRFARRARALAMRLAEWNEKIDASLAGETLIDFEAEDWGSWEAVGEAFGPAPSDTPPEGLYGWRGNKFASSYRGSDKFTGRLVSPRFTVEKQHLSFLMSGGNEPERLTVNVILNSQVLHEPEDVMATGDDAGRMIRKQFNLEAFRGQEILVEIVDESTEGHVVVDQFVTSDELPPPPEWVRTNPAIIKALNGAQSPTDFAGRIQTLLEDLLEVDRQEIQTASAAPGPSESAATDDPTAELRSWAMRDDSLLAPRESPIPTELPEAARDEWLALKAKRDAIEQSMPPSSLAIVSRDVRSVDEPLHMMGDPHNPGDVVPRGVPLIFRDSDPPEIEQGSGRLLLADWVASPDNPLTARVMVNRIWQHHFGTGLVATVDNFGRLGKSPSHPELLDYLARYFIDSGWSIKAMHRLMLMSQTYRQAATATDETIEADPDNRLLGRMPRRRLEAECIRDKLLAISGQLNPKLYGASVPVHLTPFMRGEDLPLVSGPADGDRRRSIYLEVRRNHLTPLLETFDFPKPESTVGQRSTALLPAQALAMLNNPFVAQQASAWANRVVASDLSEAERIEQMFRTAFARQPTAAEIDRCRQFLATQRDELARQGLSDAEAERQAWSDLCHVVFNLEEFAFVR